MYVCVTHINDIVKQSVYFFVVTVIGIVFLFNLLSNGMITADFIATGFRRGRSWSFNCSIYFTKHIPGACNLISVYFTQLLSPRIILRSLICKISTGERAVKFDRNQLVKSAKVISKGNRAISVSTIICKLCDEPTFFLCTVSRAATISLTEI